ncbi:acyl carrier protein [Magnetospirillum aberrantis]|uniref:Acyl carrier protein n=1 Tax=Magnetospirillum aberrantis SpK TaxID=908842 RepID=A0A7C9UZV6_9PROT|nr:acyl carrier protein [Magnetospirillum aberrantis]NFV82272.1 acyl carrier protein [Magnetospirillum aberrantis SpK]
MSLSRDSLIALIQELTPVPGLDSDTIAASEELLTGGMIDSLGLMQIIEAIERALGKSVPPGAISIDNFNSLTAIEALQAKLAA